MSANYDTQDLVVNETENQFELPLDSGKAVIEYIITGDKINLVHTEVPPRHRGKDIASILTKKVLQHIQKKNLTVVPSCPFIAKFMDNHPEYHGLLSEGYQM